MREWSEQELRELMREEIAAYHAEQNRLFVEAFLKRKDRFRELLHRAQDEER